MADLKNIGIVDRVVERLKAQPLGDLITEEDLFDIVKEAIPRVFFAERDDPKDTSTYNRRKLPPLIIECMCTVMQPAIQTAVNKWTEEHRQEILEYWLKVSDKGIETYVQKLQEEKTRSMVQQMLRPLVEQYNSIAMASGRPQIFI